MEHPYDPDSLESTCTTADASESHTDEEDPAPSVHPNFNFELVVFQASSTLRLQRTTHIMIFQGWGNAL